MASTRSNDETLELLRRTIGCEISGLQIRGINSLKSVTPSPEDVVGSVVSDVAVSDRHLHLFTGEYVISIDLQRTGRLTWLNSAAPVGSPLDPRPTVRLLLADGAGIDFSEPAKTKRIAVKIQYAGAPTG